MKKIFLFLIIASCFWACDPNSPQTPTDKPGDTTIDVSCVKDVLDNLVSLIGYSADDIVSCEKGADDTYVIKDKQGNTITIDSKKCITIVWKDGSVTCIDSSIKEDKSANKDKWYNSVWFGKVIPFGEIWIDEPTPIDKIIAGSGFQFDVSDFDLDSTHNYIDTCSYCKLNLFTTSCSVNRLDSMFSCEDKYTYHYKKYTLKGQGESSNPTVRFRYEIVDKVLNVYIAYYDPQTMNLVEERLYYSIPNFEGYLLKEISHVRNSSTKDLMKVTSKTTYFNYRRISEDALLLSNLEHLYDVKEGERTDGSHYQDLYIKEGNIQYVTLDLVGF